MHKFFLHLCKLPHGFNWFLIYHRPQKLDSYSWNIHWQMKLRVIMSWSQYVLKCYDTLKWLKVSSFTCRSNCGLCHDTWDHCNFFIRYFKLTWHGAPKNFSTCIYISWNNITSMSETYIQYHNHSSSYKKVNWYMYIEFLLFMNYMDTRVKGFGLNYNN